MKLKAYLALASACGMAFSSLGCTADKKQPDSAANLSQEDLGALRNEQLAARLYQLTREQRTRETLLLHFPPVPDQPSNFQDRLEEIARKDDLSSKVAPDYLAFYDRPTLLAAVRFFQSDAGRTYALRQQAVDMQVARKEQVWAVSAYSRARAEVEPPPEAPSSEAPPIDDVSPDTAADAAPSPPAELAPAGRRIQEDSRPVRGTKGEIERAKKTCKQPALKPLPAAEPAELLERLTGRWYACAGRFDIMGQEGPQAAAGLEVASGRWYLLDAAADGTLVRRPMRDMRDQFAGRVAPDNGNLLFTFDAPTGGLGGFMASLLFSSTAPAMDFDQTRLVRVDAK